MTRQFAAGAYAATFDTDGAVGAASGKGEGSQPLGLVQDVFWWRRSIAAVPVRSNLVAEMPLDALYTGGDCFCRFTVKEWNPATRAMLWPFDEAMGTIGPVGARLSHYAGQMTLTAAEGTLAEEHGPAVLRFGKAILAPATESEIPLGRVERDVPILLQCFPYVTPGGNQVWFETD